MNRRNFLRGIIAAAVVVSIPASIVKAVVGRTAAQAWATQKLTVAYFDACKGQGAKGAPREFLVGKDFYEMFYDELTLHHRYVSEIPKEVASYRCNPGPAGTILRRPADWALMFKNMKVWHDGTPGYEILRIS